MKQNKIGFTLAEVLIVLGIIGVVAALTIPALTREIQKRVWVTALKKDVAYIQEGFRMMLAQEGVDSLVDVDMWRETQKAEAEPDAPANAGNMINKKYMPKYFRHIQYNEYDEWVSQGVPSGNKSGETCKQWVGKGPQWYWLSNSNKCYGMRNDRFILPNGGHLYMAFTDQGYYENTGKLKRCFGNIYIDVNGFSGPNMWGRDAFFFYLSDNGILYAEGSEDLALYKAKASNSQFNNIYWKTSSTSYRTCTDEAIKSKSTDGEGCTGRLIENNWVMDY